MTFITIIMVGRLIITDIRTDKQVIITLSSDAQSIMQILRFAKQFLVSKSGKEQEAVMVANNSTNAPQIKQIGKIRKK